VSVIDKVLRPESASVRQQGTSAVRERREWSLALRRLYVAGLVALALQLTALAIWSQFEASRLGLSVDYSLYAQGWYLLAHGVFNPYTSVMQRYLWQDHSAFLFWLLSPLWYVWPHPATLLWLQDLAIVAAETVGWRWMCEHLDQREDRLGRRSVVVISLFGLVTYLSNPWIVWSLSNDFHFEIIGVLFLVLAARDFYASRTRAWLWVALALGTSNLAATFLVGLALGLVVASRHRWREAGALLGVGLGWSIFTDVIGGARGSAFTGYAYLLSRHTSESHVSVATIALAALEHPLTALAQVTHHGWAIWADVSSSGLIGVLSPWAIGVPLISMTESALNASPLYIAPNLGFQNIPGFIFLPVGSVFVLAALTSAARRSRRPRGARRSVAALTAVLVVLSVGWALVWFPKTAQQWITVPASAATQLRAVETSIPASSEVIVSQGVIGEFAQRSYVYPVYGYPTFPVQSSDVWFVITPGVGIEPQGANDAMRTVRAAASLVGATLVSHRDRVWVVHWPDAPLGVVSLASSATVPAAIALGPAGRSVTSGLPSSWHVSTTGQAGYVVDHDYFAAPSPGRYVASVSARSRGPLEVEAWDVTTNALLGRLQTVETGGLATTRLTVTIARVPGEHLFAGVIPWYSPPPLFSGGDQIEVRVFAPSNVRASVYNVAFSLVPPVR
jgi:hypothetical protein